MFLMPGICQKPVYYVDIVVIKFYYRAEIKKKVNQLRVFGFSRKGELLTEI